MTITIAWIRRIKDTVELVIASDSRLRSFGAMDQCQKIFPLQRGDSALAFCGDADVAYPFFVQAASSLNAFIKTRTRAHDVHATAAILRKLLNNIVSSWDASLKHKTESFKDTRILFCGWSWRRSSFQIGFFKFIDGKFVYLTATERLPKPWNERYPSLIVLGDYRSSYIQELGKVIARSNTYIHKRIPVFFDLQYEPIEALNLLLKRANSDYGHNLIGGAPQIIKIYPHSNVLPIVVRMEKSKHYLFGRKLFSWEKVEYPILDLTFSPVRFYYPMSYVPRASDVGTQAPIEGGVSSIRRLIFFLSSRGR